MKYIIEARNVSKTFNGVKALREFSLDVRVGEVHCLVGENGCGKSTFMKIIAGVVKPDFSNDFIVKLNEKIYEKITPIESMSEGIQVIYQDLSLFPNLTVAENIAMNQRIETNQKIISWKDFESIAYSAMDTIQIDLDIHDTIETLPIAHQQLVAICRAITSGVRLLIMDEPTASLGKSDVEHLLNVIQKLKDKGVSILFVGHKLDEVFSIADRITILRDGVNVKTIENVNEVDEKYLAELMTGKNIKDSRYKRKEICSRPLLKVVGLERSGEYEDIHFELLKGEIIGIIGLVGAGRTELVSSIFGLRRPEKGDIFIDGKKVKITKTKQAIKHGIGFVPENRLTEGLFMDKSISDNIIVTVIDSIRKFFSFLDFNQKRTTSESWLNKLNIKAPSIQSMAKELSGGNQQRVVLSKWLVTKPKILILDGPTIGIDVGAKSEIHNLMNTLSEEGMGIIMVTDEVSEVLHNSSKILIMKERKIIAQFDSTQVSEEELKSLLT